MAKSKSAAKRPSSTKSAATGGKSAPARAKAKATESKRGSTKATASSKQAPATRPSGSRAETAAKTPSIEDRPEAAPAKAGKSAAAKKTAKKSAAKSPSTVPAAKKTSKKTRKSAVTSSSRARVSSAAASKKSPATAKKKSSAASPAKAATTGRGTGRIAEPLDDELAAELDAPIKPFKGKPNGPQLVIVESPAKAKTINRYLGSGFEVRASVGHIRDLPSKGKGKNDPVPGVDVRHGFRPSYEILAAKQRTVAELRKAARGAADIWFATDLDREGEAIAWHLAHVLGIAPATAKRVVFNAITKTEIQRAFSHPRSIDEGKVNAQQARRILDRIVGYQASPLLWRKVARGLSAGRVQSVAVRLVVEREREIAAFIPDETWRVTVRLTQELREQLKLAAAWRDSLAQTDDKGKGPTQRTQTAWMGEHEAVRAELVELDGQRFELGCSATAPRDLLPEIQAVAQAVGLTDIETSTQEVPDGRGPARYRRTLEGRIDAKARYRVRDIETKRSTSKAPPPFITSSLQIAASSALGYGAQRTMRLAQELYEGVDLDGEGRVALITYMRTDSTHLSGEAIDGVRDYISRELGAEYLPASPQIYASANKDAQEAHEAIRPNDVARDPESIRRALHGPRAEELYRLYKLIWNRFVGCQMQPAKWDQTAVTFERCDPPGSGKSAKRPLAVLRATGRVLAFDGHYRVTGVPNSADEQTLPALTKGKELAPFSIDAEQKFSAAPARYTEASLVKTLESEGIGRPSTYASIIQVIQDRQYVEQRDKRFHATDLGEVVTDKMIEAFPDLMDLGYTRLMEAQLDSIEEGEVDWVGMLGEFYERFSVALEAANESMTHAKAELTLAPYACPTCGARTCYRFGKNGRFLSCTRYPECNFAGPIDRDGRPMLPEILDLVSPIDGTAMQLRNGRFGPFIASVAYPESDFVLNVDKKGGIKAPAPPPVLTDVACPKCSSPMNLRRGKRGPWLGCSTFPKCKGRKPWNDLPEADRAALEKRLEAHEKAHPTPVLRRRDGTVVADGTPVTSLVVPGELAQLAIHPEHLKSAE